MSRMKQIPSLPAG